MCRGEKYIISRQKKPGLLSQQQLFICLILAASLLLSSVAIAGKDKEKESIIYPQLSHKYEEDITNNLLIFHYEITDIKGGNTTFTIDTSELCKQSNGRLYKPIIGNCLSGNQKYQTRVYFHVSGDIEFAGNGGFEHNGKPGAFRIYGNRKDSDDTNDQTFEIKGTTQVSGFIYALDAHLGIKGGGGSGGFYGAVWAKTWGVNAGNGSNADGANITVPENLAEALGLDLSTVDGVDTGVKAIRAHPPTSQERQSVTF